MKAIASIAIPAWTSERAFRNQVLSVAKTLDNISKGSTRADAACAVIVLQRDGGMGVMQDGTSKVRHISGVDR